MIITISGTPGSGKGTVGKLLAKKLGYRYYSIGGIRRAMAIERGMTLQEFNVLGEQKAFTDRDIDAWQKKLGQTKDNLIVEGRTSFHFIPHSVKLFLKADIQVAAKRIFKDTAHVRQFEASHRYSSPTELAHGLRHRIASDNRRYKKYYGLNIFLPKHYDVVIDTTKLTPNTTLRKIIKVLAKISPVRGQSSVANMPKSGRLSREKRLTSNGVSQNKAKVDSMGMNSQVIHKKSPSRKSKGRTKKSAKVSKK